MPKKNPTAALSFEELYSKLQAIIETLEGGNLTLDEALALYEQGMALAQQCNVMLDQAELRIQELAPGPSAEITDDLDAFDEDDA
ncbi:MAG: Exodeoxyribonuclease 7 small subunit [Anaerolineae bacterium]|nr:Exodeoxyribonuclease 7 small subunit [Anaerolineae bacterium]RIK32106.1 MAG: exodeoxyribonuclease VII small subunit [Chloroflexota bacterium]